MRKFLLLLLLTIVIENTYAQVNFQSIAFKDALQRANAEGKLVFLQFEAATCNQCNEVANKGFSDKPLANQIEQTFIPLKITTDHPDRSAIAAQYNIKEFGSFFINQSGTLVHDYRRTTSNPRDYLKQIDMALEKAGESLKVNELEKEYKNGNKSPGFMEALLSKKQSLNLPTEDLLDEYVSLLPADSLKSVRTLQFIANMAPSVGSNASTALRKDRTLFNQAWYLMSNPIRVGINNRIIHKSITKAIQQKNERYALEVAAFTQGTYTGNPLGGIKAYDKNMLYYYEETGDTTAYFKKAIAYYERHFVTISADSIKRMDSINRQRVFASAKKDTIKTANGFRIASSVGYSPVGQYYANELNDGALNFYKKTSNSYLLAVATEWAARAVSFYQSPEILDTYARLLYKQGQKDKAIATETSAVSLKKERGYSTKELEGVLDKMKKGAAAID